ncbi:nucleoporin Nup186/Nup192/Nup205 [Kalaharituber pfeilii]|nr:nucleoporin Nup186/Nup192/Nup205 [Kalaharituber pfeilii]
MAIHLLSEVDFSILCDSLVSATAATPPDVSAEDLLYNIENCLDELKKVLTVPPKSDASRQKIKEGQVTVLGDEYKLNNSFIEETIKLSDDLNLDETVAATLLIQGQQLSDRLDRNTTQSAIFIFHRSRLNLFQSLRIIFSAILDENVDPSINVVLQKAMDLILHDHEEGAYYQACLHAMSTTRSYIHKLREKEGHSRTLGHDRQPGWNDWVEDLHVQLRFLTGQHEALATILFCLAKHKRATLSSFKKMLESMGAFEDYNILVAHHIPPVYALITMLCSSDTQLSFLQVINLHRELWGMYQDTRASNELADVTNTLDYSKDVYQPAKRALKEGAFEYMLAVATDVGLVNDLDINRDNLREFLQGQAKRLSDAHLLSEEFKKLVMNQFEQFIDSFIANMADILKDLKTKEEEVVLLQQKDFELDLERFFFIISYIYYGRPDAALTFWNDPESNLYGFLMWASSNLTPLMATVMSYMLASFSFGEQCSAHAHKFLKEEFAPGIARQRRGNNYLSWGTIFQKFEQYINQLGSTRQQLAPTSLYRPPPPPIDTTEPGLETTLIIDAYIRLIGRIALESEDARTWLYERNASFAVMDALFELLEKRTPSQLLASIFSTVASFLAGRKCLYAEEIWSAVDQWAFGSRPSPTAIVATPASPFSPTGVQNLESIKHSIYPAEAFIKLLVALVSPAEDGLNDSLPFPENLGSSTRLSGIDPYVDFVMRDVFRATLWQVFSRPKEDLNTASINIGTTLGLDSLMGAGLKKNEQLPPPNPIEPQSILRSNVQSTCLQFILACLTSFNEDLILYAKDSNISVDMAIQSSSLRSYAKLHPFGRVMEHLLTEKCIAVLFEILRHGVLSLYKAPEGSPLADTVLMTIEVLELMCQLQSTYNNVVRPLILEDEGRRRDMLSLGGFSSIEDAFLYSLDIAVCLGICVEVGDAAIATAALRLLERLVVSPTLIQAPEVSFGRQVKRNRILNILENHPDSKRVQFGFIHRIEAASEETGVVDLIKLRILGLLNASLEANPAEPSVAHFLLGFEISDGAVDIGTVQGGIGSGVSLFHSILDIVMGLDEKPSNVLEYENTKCELKNQCYNVLRLLWKSKLTTADTMYALRTNKFLIMQFSQETLITPNTLWDGRTFRNQGEFMGSESVNTLCWFLDRRSSLFDYIGLEIRQLASQGATTTVTTYLSTLLGNTITEGAPVANVHILDLLDFLELEIPQTAGEPQMQWFKDVDFTAAQKAYGTVIISDINSVRSLLLLKKKELEKQGRMQPAQEESIQKEMQAILDHAAVESNFRLFKQSRVNCLKAWTQLIEVILENCEFEQTAKAPFLLQTLQTILPKLEQYSTSDVEGAQELSSLAHFLISHINFDSTTFGKGRASDIANDRLYQLFRVSLRCIQSPLSHGRLREDFYNISYRYLKGMTDLQEKVGATIGTRHSTQSIKAAGDRLLEVVCTDAYAGEGTCKIVALMLLEELVALGMQEGNTYVVDALVRTNFLVVLVDTIHTLVKELYNSAVNATFALIFFKAATGFLLRVAQTRSGAGHVINAGLFQALKDSKLFQVDPDLGIGFHDPQSISKYYELVLWVLRVVSCCILSKGPQNAQTMSMGRKFLEENRNVAINVFKRHANIGGTKVEGVGELRELTEMFVLLMSLTGYIEAREEAAERLWHS